MARKTHHTTHPDSSNTGILSRLRTRPAKTTHSESTNPITGTHTTTTTRKTHPKGHAHHAGEQKTPAHHRRKPGVGDKISGAMLKAKGEVTRRPGVKGAGTRRMHGTDGKVKKRKR